MIKKSGILLHPTALPGPYGIGEIGPYAYKFIDQLVSMGQSFWQILPIGPTDSFNSPYSSSSTFAGNPLIISLDLLVQDGLLDKKYLKKYKSGNPKKVEFNNVKKNKMSTLKKVSNNFDSNASLELKKTFRQFCINNSYWLDNYASYCALKEKNNYKPWIEWDIKTTNSSKYMHETKVIQFLFHDQWNRLHKYCQSKEIKIIGDMPIYVGYDSADVYFNQDLFQLDDNGRMLFQSGCPPCEFQSEGQLWGTPLYDWENQKKTNFEWWEQRFKKLFEMVDIIRLDHFIGFVKYYRIPIDDQTAKNGEWINSSGDELFEILKSRITNFNVIAEDLGDLTQEVVNLKNKYSFPGMAVIQFEQSNILTNNCFPDDVIIYTGTHDNDTMVGWFNSLPVDSNDENELTKSRLLDFFDCKEDSFHWEIIKYLFINSNNIVIIPMQDILRQSSKSRFNTPGTLNAENWSWRMEENKLTKSIKKKLTNLTKIYLNNNNVKTM